MRRVEEHLEIARGRGEKEGYGSIKEEEIVEATRERERKVQKWERKEARSEMQMSPNFGVVGRLGRGQEREVPREEREGQGRRRLPGAVMPHLQQEGLNKNTARAKHSKVKTQQGQKGSGRKEDDMVGRTIGGSSLVCDSSGLCGRGSLLRWSSLLWRG